MVDHGQSSTGGGSSSRDAPREGHQIQNANISSIDDVISFIRSFEVAQDQQSNAASTALLGQIRDNLLPSLKKQYHSLKGGKGQRLFTQALQGGYDPLSMLNPARNTLGYAYILACRANQAGDVVGAQSLLEYIDSFARFFNPAQLVGAGEIVTLLAKSIANIGQLLDNPIGALTSIIRIFDGYRTVQGGHYNLTTLHPIVVYQCLRAQHYDAAYDWVLKYDVISADEHITPLSSSDVLEYFYYSGMVFTRLNILDKACESFELCVNCPAQQVSAIQIDAFKKLLLVQLLKDGKTSSLAKYTSQAVNRAIRNKLAGLEHYQGIATAYEAQQKFCLPANQVGKGPALERQLNSNVEASMNLLLKDVNFGLVKRVLESYTRRRIQRLSKVFNRLKIGTIVDMLGGEIEGLRGDKACDAVVKAIEQMNTDQWFLATFENRGTPKDSIVQFEEVEVDHTGLKAVQKLIKVMHEAKFWNQTVEDKKGMIKSSEAFLNKQMNNNTNRGGDWTSAINADDYDDEAFL